MGGQPSASHDDLTVPTESAIRLARRSRALRRLFVALLTAFVLAGLAGMFGVRTTAVSASGGGYDLTVRFAAVSRPGLATPWEVEVRRVGGFDGDVTLATTRAYFEVFDQSAVAPEPTDATTSGDLLIWTFARPRGERLTVSLDGRVEPARHVGEDAVTAVLVDGLPVVRVVYSTRVVP